MTIGFPFCHFSDKSHTAQGKKGEKKGLRVFTLKG